VDGEMVLSEVGEVAEDGWVWIEEQYPYVSIDIFCMLPNHTHAIVQIKDISYTGRGGSRTAPTERKSLSSLVGAYKTDTTKRINRFDKFPGKKFWQRSYYDHIVRNEEDLENIRVYITDNVLKWEFDRDNPDLR
jgi:REP element-mobilizing transposase RayT